MTPVRWVRQEQLYGCVAAAGAMLLGITYAESVALFEGHVDFDIKGCGSFVLESILAERGVALCQRYRTYQPGNQKRALWPCEPFGDVHLCEVICLPNSPGAHAVVMLADGSVLDPMFEEPRRLSDYHAVNYVAAVVPVAKG